MVGELKTKTERRGFDVTNVYNGARSKKRLCSIQTAIPLSLLKTRAQFCNNLLLL